MKIAVLLLSFIAGLYLSAYDLTPYKTIVCFGDSITHGGQYHTLLQEYLAETDPAHPRRVINRGISGDTVPGLLKRVDRMLKTDKPDLVMIMIGINDLQFTTKFAEKDKALPFETAAKKYPVFNRFEKNLGELLDILNKAKVKVVVLATPPYNESANPGIKSKVSPNMDTTGVRNLIVIEKRLAKEKGADFIDIYTPMLRHLQENDASFPRSKVDRVHPSYNEHLLIAQTILGKKYKPGKKQAQASAYGSAQGQIQSHDAYLLRIPAKYKTVDEQIEFYKKWVAKLKGNDFKYWNKTLPAIIDFLKNKDAKYKELYQKRDKAFQDLYQ